MRHSSRFWPARWDRRARIGWVGALAFRERVFLRAAFATLGVTIAGTAVYAAVGPQPSIDHVMRDWVPSLVYVIASALIVLRVIRVREGRGPWIVIAAGIMLYTAGTLVWSLWLQNLPAPPFPSLSNALWLSMYPAAYLGLVWLARGKKGQGAPAGVWLDGIVAGLGIAALGAAVVLGPTQRAATGNFVALATNLAEPIADLILAGLVMGILALRGFRLDRVWILVGGGFLLLCIGDIMFVLNVAGGATSTSSTSLVFYLAAVASIAWAAWQRQDDAPTARLEGWSMLLIPGLFALTAIGLLVYDHFVTLDAIAMVLATVTLLMALLRTTLTFRDVRTLTETRRQATTDDLTSLPNRRLFMQRAAEGIAGARAVQGSLALLIIDLDRFKELNDTMGHQAGDGLLRQIGPRVLPILRPTDTLARLGGDEFGLLLGPPCDEASALHVAERVRDALRAPFEIDGLHLKVAASVGIGVFPLHADDAERLLQCADIAMYQAKASHSGREVYAADQERHSRDNLALTSELPQAIEQGQLEVHFQPKAEARGRRLVGAEALVRWRHPERGLLPPVAFLALAEHSGLGRELTRCVMADALERCRHWRAAGHDLHVAVNASVVDLLDLQFPDEVAAALTAHDVPASALMIEVTESSVMSDPVRISDVLARLGELGIGISLDDFGTGYSSLVHLRKLPVCEIKIDRSFVSGMGSMGADLAIVRATIRLAHELGLRVVAEGVEDDATWQRLADLDCEIIQGYYLARPMPAAEFEAFLVRADTQADEQPERDVVSR
ncbi:MAG: diguanylate cyclase [Thermoleophilaceae bacterium]|jgi:diguanylate cyclase (GGDEF)-like protein|nr:diguanylate cyclase [Thermoleophilaceae bacterium]